jgi:competence protein ComFC
MAIKIEGPWDAGVVIDKHTLSSEFLGNNEYGRPMFDTKRTEIGELVYQLKYQSNQAVLPHIVQLVKESIKSIELFDAIVPIPPSNQNRALQPVYLISEAIGKQFNVPVVHALNKNSLEEMKGVLDKTERIDKLRETVAIQSEYDFNGKAILIIDDLFDSGSTLSVAAELVKDIGKARYVGVLAMTKTKG